MLLHATSSDTTRSLASRMGDTSWLSSEQQQRPQHDVRPLRIVDLFCGCGGLTLGAAEAAKHHGRRLEIALAMDTSDLALKVYKHNFQAATEVIYNEPIENCFGSIPGRKGLSESERSISEATGSVDFLIAGPPCQGHSDLNNHTRRNDKRNRLYMRAVRASIILKPAVVLLENVPAIRHDRSSVLAQARRALSSHGGYAVSESIISFDSLGVAQKRKRHVLVGVRGGLFDISKELPSIPFAKPTVGNAIAGLEDEHLIRHHPFYQPSSMSQDNLARVNYLFSNNLFDLPNELRPPCHRDKRHSYKSAYGRMPWNAASQTITSGFGSMGQGRYVHPSRPRTITPHEAARLQGFPDFFEFTPVSKATALREMIANAVPPQLSAIIASRLMSAGLL